MNLPSRPELTEAYGEPCPYCRETMMFPHRVPTREHVHPRASGGNLANHNRLVVCYPCNQDKGDLRLWDWARALRAAGDKRAKWVLKLAYKRHAERKAARPRPTSPSSLTQSEAAA